MENKRQVRDAVKEAARECPHDLACLNESGHESFPCCMATDRAAPDILFVTCGDDGPCPYRLSWGYGHICRCPVHYVLHPLHIGCRQKP